MQARQALAPLMRSFSYASSSHATNQAISALAIAILVFTSCSATC